MRNPSVVRFELVWLPDSILAKLIEGFRQSDCDICVELVEKLSRERERRSRGGAAMVEIVLPLVAPGEIFDAKVGLLASSAAMLELAEAEQNTLESPSGYQLAAELCVEIVHALDRQLLHFEFLAHAATN